MRSPLFNPLRLIAKECGFKLGKERDYSPRLVVLINLTITALTILYGFFLFNH